MTKPYFLVPLLILAACSGKEGDKPQPTPTPSVTSISLPASSPTPEASPSASPVPTLTPEKIAGLSDCKTFKLMNQAGWIYQSYQAHHDQNYERLGCPLTGEKIPSGEKDNRYAYQVFEKGCIGWDWKKPANYVVTNYIAMACDQLPYFPEASPSPSASPSVTQSPSPKPSASPITDSSPVAGKAIFPVGVWFQPYSSFDKWKSRGINTLFGPELEGHPGYESRWFEQGYQKGFQFVARPDFMATPKVWPGLVAFMQPDEPDIHAEGHLPLPGEALKPLYDLVRSISTLPVFCSFAGPRILDSKPAVYTAYAPYCDWFSEDWYPINRNYLTYPFNHKSLAMNKALTAMGGNKRPFSIIESSNQMINCPAEPQVIPLSRAPTPDEFRGEIWHVIIHGAKGVIFFPQTVGNPGCKPVRFGGFNFDTTPPDVAAEMLKQSNLLQANAVELLKPIQSIVVPAPFDAAKIGKLTVVLNLSNAPAKYTDGKTYGPYEVTIHE